MLGENFERVYLENRLSGEGGGSKWLVQIKDRETEQIVLQGEYLIRVRKSNK